METTLAETLLDKLRAPSRLLTETPAHYAARAAECYTAADLAAFAHCPLAMRQRRAGLIPTVRDEHSRLSAAAHTLLLHGQEFFDANYTVGGPINPTTEREYGEETKAYRTWEAEQCRPVLSSVAHSTLLQMEDAFIRHPLHEHFFRAGIPSTVVRDEICGLWFQTRLDWLTTRAAGVDLIDLRVVKSLDRFQGAILGGLALRAALAKELFYRATRYSATVRFVAVECRIEITSNPAISISSVWGSGTTTLPAYCTMRYRLLEST